MFAPCRSRLWARLQITIRVSLLLALASSGCTKSTNTIVEIAVHPKKPDILYAATNEYVYKTRNGGETWEALTKGMSHSRVIAIVIDPELPANVYLGTKGDAVYKSYDGGGHWSSQRNGLEDVTITSVVHQLVVAPDNHRHLYAATSMGVFETRDGGESWEKRMVGMKEVLMVVTIDTDPRRAGTLYAGTSGGVYKSLDGAQSWKKVNAGLVPPDVLKSSRALGVTRIRIDPHQEDVVYAATLRGVYKTEDGGRSWKRIGQTLPDQMISEMLLDPVQPKVVYVASRKGVHKSQDGGATWQPMNTGLRSLNIRALALSPVDHRSLYAGTNGTGLYHSMDGGETWKSLPLTVEEGTEKD